MPAMRVIRAVDVLEDGGFGLSTGVPHAAPDHLCLDVFEEGFDTCIVIAIALAAHRRFEVMLAQDLLIVV